MASRTNGTDGWGNYLQYSFDTSVAIVDNEGAGGRSARTFTREGRFKRVADSIVSGDWVVMEFGHNDDGQPETDVKGRVDCPGFGMYSISKCEVKTKSS